MSKWSVIGYVERFYRDPRLLEILVEGRSDRLIIDWWLRKRGVRGRIGVALAEDITPSKAVTGVSFRASVIEVIEKLAMRYPKCSDQLIGIVDRDFEIFENIAPLPNLKNLFSTDFRDSEMTLFDPDLVERYIYFQSEKARSGGTKGSALLESISEALLRLSLIRATLHLEGFGIGFEFAPKEHVMRSRSGLYELKADVVREIFTGQDKNKRERFDASYAARMAASGKLLRDVDALRYYIRGHDYISLLKYVVRHEMGLSRLQHVDDYDFALELFGLLSQDDWSRMSLFNRVSAWLDASLARNVDDD